MERGNPLNQRHQWNTAKTHCHNEQEQHHNHNTLTCCSGNHLYPLTATVTSNINTKQLS